MREELIITPETVEQAPILRNRLDAWLARFAEVDK